MTPQKLKFKQRLGRMLATALLAISIGGSAANAQPIAGGPPAGLSQQPQSPQAATKRLRLSSEDVAERLMHSTCHIIAVKSGKIAWSGTGWVLDAQKKLIVTNHHVAIGTSTLADELRFFLPVKRNGQWENSLRYYLASVRYGKGTVIATTRQHDLALVQLDYLPPNAKSLPLVTKSVATGARLHTIGGKPAGSANLWSYSDGKVRQVGAGGHGLGNNSRVIQSTLATNPGNSGGPVVNDYCEIVGVHAAGSRLGKNTTIHIDILAVRDFLGQSRPLANPTTARAFYLRGRNRAADKLNSLALADFSSAIQKNPKFTSAYSQRGLLFLATGDSRTAIGDLNQAIQLDSTSAEAYAARGYYYRRIGQSKNAVTDYSNAIRFDSKNASHYNNRGLAELDQSNAKSAYQDFAQATKIQPANAVYVFNRGLTERLIGAYKQSLASFDKAFTLGLRTSVVFFQSGMSYMSLKQYQSAFKFFKAANERYKKAVGKDRSLYRKYMGLAMFNLNQLQEAYKHLSIAIQLDPNNAELYALRGTIAKKFADAKNSAADFQKAAQLNPKQYGNLTAGNTQQPNGNGQTPTASASIDSRLVGVWRVQATSSQGTMVINYAFTSNGGFAFRFSKFQGNQKQQVATSGTFAVQSTTIVMVKKDGGKTSFRYTFRNGKLGMFVAKSGKWMFLTRIK